MYINNISFSELGSLLESKKGYNITPHHNSLDELKITLSNMNTLRNSANSVCKGHIDNFNMKEDCNSLGDIYEIIPNIKKEICSAHNELICNCVARTFEDICSNVTTCSCKDRSSDNLCQLNICNCVSRTKILECIGNKCQCSCENRTGILQCSVDMCTCLNRLKDCTSNVTNNCSCVSRFATKTCEIDTCNCVARKFDCTLNADTCVSYTTSCDCNVRSTCQCNTRTVPPPQCTRDAICGCHNDRRPAPLGH